MLSLTICMHLFLVMASLFLLRHAVPLNFFFPSFICVQDCGKVRSVAKYLFPEFVFMISYIRCILEQLHL